MLQLFRSFFKSKIGIVITLIFLGLIALAFASMDVASTGTFGGVTGGDRVAIVGDRRVNTSDLSNNVTNSFNQARQEDPTLTMEVFAANGGIEQVLKQMLSRVALAAFADEHGMRAGKRLVDSEIRQIPAFRDLSGNFSQDIYQSALRQQGLNDAAVRDDLAMGLLARQVVTPLMLGSTMPGSLAQRYAQLLRETRRGAVAFLPSAAFAPKGNPAADQLQAYYQRNRGSYVRPERRVIRYAVFGDDALGELAAPTQAQIAARYQRDIAQYQQQEDRTFTQLIVPTQAAAQAIVNEVRGGVSLDRSAQAKGLATAQVGPVSRDAFAQSTSARVAQAGFAAASGAIATPAQGGLGWYVLRVETIDTRRGRTLAQARDGISQALATEQRSTALGDLTVRIEEELDDGRNLDEVANELGVELQRTRPLTAAGQIYGSNEPAPAQVAPVIQSAFEMDQEEPQLAVLEPGALFMVYDVSDITPSAAAPLAEIRDGVEAAWRRDQGLAAAREASNRVQRHVAGGQTLAAAIAAETTQLPAIDAVNLNRQQISQQGQVPPVLALLFSMAEGTVKRLQAPANTGWFVVALDDISTPELASDDPIVAATGRELQGVIGDEYVQQFVRAVENQVGVERNQAAVDAVITQLTGQAN